MKFDKHGVLNWKKFKILTSVISLDAAAADMCNDGCLTLELQSNALANVPTDLDTTRNWSICRSVKPWYGVHTNVSNGGSVFRGSGSPITL